MRTEVLEHFAERTPAMLSAIQSLVEVESPSSDIDSLEQCAQILATYVTAMTGKTPTWLRGGHDGRPHLRFDYGERTDVLLVGHFDTVHPLGTIDRVPFSIEGDRAYGPGVLDMKAGLVIMTELVQYFQSVTDEPNITLFFNSDEESGSLDSGPLLRDIAPPATLIIALEYTDPSGLVKIGARGGRAYRVTVTGKGGHAAYPEINKNPVEALADIIVQARRAHDPSIGRVVVPTILEASESVNVVPDSASVSFDVRVSDAAYYDDVDKIFSRFALDEGFDVEVDIELEFPVHKADFDGYPYQVAKAAGAAIGLEVRGVEARGASDANQVAPVNANALEALGAAGDGSHSEREHLFVSLLPRQAALCTLMVEQALSDAAGLREGVEQAG